MIDYPQEFFQLGRHAYECIAEAIENPRYFRNRSSISRLSEPQMVLYVVQNFIAEAGGGGIAQYILNDEGKFCDYLVFALDIIGANEAKRRIISALILANSEDWSPEFLDDPEVTAYVNSLDKSLCQHTELSIEEGIYELVNHDTQLLLDKFVASSLLDFYSPIKIEPN